MIISRGKFTRQSLAGKVAVVTGAGGGIGLEAARSLVWLGAQVVLAEINKESGRNAEKLLNQEFGDGSALFVHTDIGDERSINAFSRQVIQKFDRVDIVINNATLAPLGAVKDVPIEEWDRSYRVNLRGPVLLARAFLPGMIARGDGIFICVTSLGQAYMAAYEAIKAAQAHLASTLDAELDGTGVIAFAIGPGYVPTPTAQGSIPRLAALMGISANELFAIVAEHEISIEAAGAGFAAAVMLAERYRGQELSSLQALIDAGIDVGDEEKPATTISLTAQQFAASLEVCRRVRLTLAEQSAGWKERSIFEQQWLVRSFNSRAGMTVAQWLSSLEQIEAILESQDAAALTRMQLPLEKLANYYRYLYDAAKGYIKDAAQREEYLKIVLGWVDDVEQLEKLLATRT